MWRHQQSIVTSAAERKSSELDTGSMCGDRHLWICHVVLFWCLLPSLLRNSASMGVTWLVHKLDNFISCSLPIGIPYGIQLPCRWIRDIKNLQSWHWSRYHIVYQTQHERDQLQFYTGISCLYSFHCDAVSLPWRHNGRNDVSNHQPHHCLLNRLFKAQIKENIKAPRHWPLCTGDRWFPRTKGL